MGGRKRRLESTNLSDASSVPKSDLASSSMNSMSRSKESGYGESSSPDIAATPPAKHGAEMQAKNQDATKSSPTQSNKPVAATRQSHYDQHRAGCIIDAAEILSCLSLESQILRLCAPCKKMTMHKFFKERRFKR